MNSASVICHEKGSKYPSVCYDQCVFAGKTGAIDLQDYS